MRGHESTNHQAHVVSQAEKQLALRLLTDPLLGRHNADRLRTSG